MNARTKQFVATVLLICHWGAVSHSQAPEWWLTRQARTLNATPDDYALINQGQLKQLAYAAYQEMEEKLVGGAGPQITALVQSWLAPGGTERNDYTVANIGQLKALASVFHARLQEAGVAVPYTWTADTSDDADFAPANIGQAKALFAFAIPDQNAGSTITLKALRYQQVVEPGMTSPFGLWIRLEQAGQPVQSAAVNFEVYQSAGGLLYSSNLQATPQAALQATTNVQGYAGCQFKAPLQPAYCWIKATTAQVAPVWFLMIVGGGDGAFPSNPPEVDGVDYAEDSDGDGDTDAEELADGNDPKNPSSHSPDWKHWSLVTHLHHDYDQWSASNDSMWQSPGYNQYDSSTWHWFGFRTSLLQGVLYNPDPEDLATTIKPPVSAYPVLNVSTMPPLLSPGWQEGGSAKWTSQNTIPTGIVTEWYTSAGESDGVTNGQLIPIRGWDAQALKVEIKMARTRPYDQNWVMFIQHGLDKQLIEARNLTIPAGSKSTGPMVIYYPPVLGQFDYYSINFPVEVVQRQLAQDGYSVQGGLAATSIFRLARWQDAWDTNWLTKPDFIAADRDRVQIRMPSSAFSNSGAGGKPTVKISCAGDTTKLDMNLNGGFYESEPFLFVADADDDDSYNGKAGFGVNNDGQLNDQTISAAPGHEVTIEFENTGSSNIGPFAVGRIAQPTHTISCELVLITEYGNVDPADIQTIERSFQMAKETYAQIGVNLAKVGAVTGIAAPVEYWNAIVDKTIAYDTPREVNGQTQWFAGWIRGQSPSAGKTLKVIFVVANELPNYPVNRLTGATMTVAGFQDLKVALVCIDQNNQWHLTLAHEIGHYVGLGHPSGERNLMLLS